MTRGLRERDFIKETFGKYVSREIRDEILAGRIPLDGEVKEVTVLFADLQNFTPMVESTPPKEVVRIINSYFAVMNEAVKAHGGLVCPVHRRRDRSRFRSPRVPARPPRTPPFEPPWRCAEGFGDLNRDLEKEAFPTLAHRIGIHTGPVVAANIGSPERAGLLPGGGLRSTWPHAFRP